MSILVNSVREKVPEKCRAKRCRKEGCSVKLSTELRLGVLVDLDRCEALAPRGATRCDYVFFCKVSGDDFVVPLELTTGKKRASKVVEQLQAGASIAEGIVCSGIRVKFRPVFAHRSMKRHEMKTLRTKRVKFGHKREIVRLIKCGSNLADVL